MNTYSTILKNTDIFYQFTNIHLELVANLCEETILNNGDTIFWERSKSDELFIIADGVVEILINPNLVSEKPIKNDNPVRIATLRRGQSFGEIALVDKGLRSATARVAQDKTRLLIIPSEKLINVCNSYPELGYRLMFNLAADLAFKIRSADMRIREELLYGYNTK